MELIKFLRENENWKELLISPPFNLTIVEDDGLVMFKYSQVSSDFNLDLVKECRGVILEKDTWKIVCRPFDKFFNYGESYAANINWDTAEVSEKIDGSLIKVFYYDGDWRVATNGTIDARSALAGLTSFYSLFRNAVANQLCFNDITDLFAALHPEYTYMFELISPYTRVVIPYNKTDIYYLGARHNNTGEYLNKDKHVPLNVKRPVTFSLGSLKDVIKAANMLDWHDEGYVVFDGINRIKVKSPAYVVAHYARQNGQVSLRHLIDVVRNNEIEEFLTYSEDLYKEKIDFIVEVFADLNETANDVWNKSVKDQGRKAYAADILKYDVPNIVKSFLFKKYEDNSLNFKNYLVDCKVRPLEVYIRGLI